MANPLQSIFDSISGAFSKKTESVVGIDVGSAFLKVVQLKKRGGRAVLETYGELALGPYAGGAVGQATNLPAEKIAEALKDLFRESNVTGKKYALSIPLGSSLLSLMEMPAVPDKELARMIPIEARKYIPVPIGEVTMDWWIVPKEATAHGEAADSNAARKVEVLVVAVHNEVIEKYKAISTSANLTEPTYELEVFAMARSSFGAHGYTTMIIDMGAATTKIAIVEYGIIRSQHIINSGGQSITLAIAQSIGVSAERAEELKRAHGLSGTEGEGRAATDAALLTLEHIFSEANRVLLNYERKQGKTIRSVILTGGGALLKGLHGFVKTRVETDVAFADPFAKVESPAFLAPVLRDAGPEFAVAIGLSLRMLEDLA